LCAAVRDGCQWMYVFRKGRAHNVLSSDRGPDIAEFFR
jgi:hypothetical protein